MIKNCIDMDTETHQQQTGAMSGIMSPTLTRANHVPDKEDDFDLPYQCTSTQVVERNNSPLYTYCYALTRQANSIYNTALFIQRQVMFAVDKDPEMWTSNEREIMDRIQQTLPQMGSKYKMPQKGKWFLSYQFLDTYLKCTQNPDYFSPGIPSQSVQQILKEECRTMKSYCAAMREYRKNPDKFLGKPKIPGYRKTGDCRTAIITNQGAKFILEKDGSSRIQLPIPKNVLAFAENLYQNEVKCQAEKAAENRKNWDAVKKKTTVSSVRVPRYTGKPPSKLFVQLGKQFAGRTDLRLKQVTITPYQGIFRINCVFQSSEPVPPVSENRLRACCIDVGVENLAAIVNNAGLPCMIVRGGVIRSVNQHYNKCMAKIVSEQTSGTSDKFKPTDKSRKLTVWRDNQIGDFLHKAGKLIVDWCTENHIELIIIGKNDNWKQSPGMGHVNNQKFVQIPFIKFLNIISYLAARQGIKVVFQEESYTSKASFPDGDRIPTYGQTNGIDPIFSGQRGPTQYHGHRKVQKIDHETGKRKTTNPEFRGLYRTGDGTIVNSDLNGSANIGRKYRADLFEIGQEPDFTRVEIIRHPDDIHCTVNENRQRQKELRKGTGPSKSAMRRKTRREHNAA